MPRFARICAVLAKAEIPPSGFALEFPKLGARLVDAGFNLPGDFAHRLAASPNEARRSRIA
jgi:hypothetical protein